MVGMIILLGSVGVSLYVDHRTAMVVMVLVLLGWSPTSNFVFSAFAISQAGAVAQQDGQAFSSAKPLGPYGAEPFIIAQLVCFVLYGFI